MQLNVTLAFKADTGREKWPVLLRDSEDHASIFDVAVEFNLTLNID